MIYQIDQSGKIEDTNKITIIAYANGNNKTLSMKAAEKQKMLNRMRIMDKPKKTFIFKAFAGLVFLLLKDEDVDEVIIDKEYPGHEATIKAILVRLFDRNELNPPNIGFALIGKKSKAHKIALETYRGERKPDIKVKAEGVLNLFNLKKSWRSSSEGR
ncbi:hypothetical protein A3J20_01170 [Candidatus Gottesmanbacteria bacterium RIFCSPLOWO2_02_FULL_42_29]|uniref:Uncharacterized protein n=1 Tax=Candidatus Gottesmanbacteria bacterium RIFCSPLOWO2_01_FULL_42_22 TaxID=1798391 RepID=A0A1F6BIN8_9BACT|nr:MAG: hypothetical protein A2781_02555 [Candidatus Gottesmanbacteria bacterium RIFCSPHIGHO2_01_FULL_42_27]OGG21229.1 MAG: hypothetical protein A3E72_00395 [Candidatus Gottesmanbacteria bacterium RIFCSPHIGHO2_12_FULL_43_26]OGG34086.1 MAG: hypothetical protein A3G68_04745 [Candidatus Gottesmanbacteria bacterium RIFCSPLOWO2_12_FULL_42_10]OGG36748.1 MAG: hypothetical protein A2968_03875 [Candidatus Gottesmanbacteria bacterium RIFCSPLOWO2_01_FULL_42_22]OGG39342.1 MAG: hypothetical protein A3J20_01